jgi:hypothetical protein
MRWRFEKRADGGIGTLIVNSAATIGVVAAITVFATGTLESNGGTLTTPRRILTGGDNLLRTGTLSVGLANASQLDMADNDAIFTNTPCARSGQRFRSWMAATTAPWG